MPLRHACAGGMVQMPLVKSKVFYFPQGHAEHTLSTVDFGALPKIPPLILCRVDAVRFLADPETDEVYAKIRLAPVGKNEQHYFDNNRALVNHNGSAKNEKNKLVCKTLTQFDANNDGGFSVPRFSIEQEIKDNFTVEMFQNFHRPTKIKFAIELKKKRSVSPFSSNLRNPKRRATPVEDSPLARLFNDVGIKVLVRKVKHDDEFVQSGKMLLLSLQGIMNDSPEECAKDIYDKARLLWEFERTLMSSCTYAIDEEPSLSDTLVAYANHASPEERMASMMKDPWLDYILWDRVVGLKQSVAFIRGLLSILIAYWNMKDLLDKYKVGEYGRPRKSAYVPPENEKWDSVTYVIDHVRDFRNLKEVLESQYSSDPELMASLFEQISSFQVDGMHIAHLLTSGMRARIKINLYSEGSCPLSLCESFAFWSLP